MEHSIADNVNYTDTFIKYSSCSRNSKPSIKAGFDVIIIMRIINSNFSLIAACVWDPLRADTVLILNSVCRRPV